MSVGYVSRSCDFPKKEILMAYISDSKMLLAKITKKRNFLNRKLYARNFGKILKNTEKIPTGLESAKNSK